MVSVGGCQNSITMGTKLCSFLSRKTYLIFLFMVNQCCWQDPRFKYAESFLGKALEFFLGPDIDLESLCIGKFWTFFGNLGFAKFTSHPEMTATKHDLIHHYHLRSESFTRFFGCRTSHDAWLTSSSSIWVGRNFWGVRKVTKGFSVTEILGSWNSLSQWRTFKLLGLHRELGKIKFNLFYFMVLGPLSKVREDLFQRNIAKGFENLDESLTCFIQTWSIKSQLEVFQLSWDPFIFGEFCSK